MRIPEFYEIRSLRLELGLTQEELAESAGITQSYIAKIESGEADPKISVLKKISKALKEASGDQKITSERIMTKPIISIKTSDKIKKAVKLMESHDISQIPVFKDRKQAGSITEETIIHRISSGENLFELVEEQVEENMEDPFPTVGKSADFDTISHLLEHNPAVIVLERGDPKGIITKADILKFSTEKRE